MKDTRNNGFQGVHETGGAPVRFGVLMGGGTGFLVAMVNSVLFLGMNPSIIGSRGTLLILAYVFLISCTTGIIAGLAVSFLIKGVNRISGDLPLAGVLMRTLTWAVAAGVALLFARALVHNQEFPADAIPSRIALQVLFLFAGSALFACLFFLNVHMLASGKRRARSFSAIALLACIPALLTVLAILVWPRSHSAQAAAKEDAQHFQASAGLLPPASQTAVPKVFLLGLDGADWDIIDRLLNEGKMPNIAKLLREGCRANLKTIVPCESPAIWTTIATGMPPEIHGITDFVFSQFYRTAINLDPLEQPSKVGFGEIQDAAESLGLLGEVPVTSRMRRSKALWNILSGAGKQSTVVGWWASWPAEEVSGTVVSDRVSYARLEAKYGTERALNGLTHPEDFLSEIHSLIVQPEQLLLADIQEFLDVDDEEAREIMDSDYRGHQLKSEFRFLLSQDRTYVNVAKHCLDARPQPDFFAVYLRGIDIISHCALRYSDVLNPSVADLEEIRKYGKAVERYYAFMDEVAGELLGRIDDGTTTLIISDHGFTMESPGEFHHTNAPDGILLAAGPDIVKGKLIDAPSVYDIAPTVLYLLDTPVAEDMSGSVIWDCIATDTRNAKVVRKVPTYGGHGAVADVSGNPEAEEEMVEHLRALGYLN
ncbi:MAG: hypothetical protein C4532_12980 [Candidatus Abyssobacteria bacterium SURF_17]|uniref:Sulfatase N-terminal domain-containing protein n=1 Tax=Candidatus Abyssobacteria bacterium SURF_17 TaxID=2093361 RepID=A0A419EV62_9BACT|nr:MAG: hypothetical protein C4532_12980 [Candidatus Abyssubacteria bacterium SURF_17]